MQRLILKNKKYITLVSGLLVGLAFASHYLLHNHAAASILMLIASILGVLPILLSAYQALKVKVVSIDVLVTIAVIGALLIGNYEESAVVTFLFLFGDFLEARTLNKTREAIRELTEMAPESALKMMEDGSYEEVPIDEVDVGDSLRVLTGAKIPVDGLVLSGEGHVNQASITGEPVPVGKQAGDQVFAGTILDNGTLHIKAERVGEDTTFGRIIELVEEAQDAKSEAERFIDRFAKWYTPAVLVLAFVVWLISRNVELAITVLVLGCPGALVIGVPVSNVAGIGNGARHGVLLKGSEVIHDFSRTHTMVFDKTGTLTVGRPEVARIQHYADDTAENRSLLFSVESESDHPLARAITLHLEGTQALPVEATDVVKGGGVLARVEGKSIALGNLALMQQQNIPLPEPALADARAMETAGQSLVFFAVDGQLQSLIGISDQLRPGIQDDLNALKRLGIRDLILLSGDNQGTVDLVAQQLSLSEAHGHMLPEDKAAYIKDLQQKGEIVAFVGDGVNDSPSLALSNIGIAMGSGTDVAIETSDVVLMNSDFSRLPHALGLAKATARNMRQNILIAVGVVIFLLLGLFFSTFINMSIGMLVHEASILVVILNGMRLLRYRLRRRK